MNNIDVTTAGGLAAGMGAVLVAAYSALRKIKGDVRVDKIDDATQKLIDNLTKQRDKDMATIERLAGERNGAMERVGSLEATIKYQTQELERMSGEVTKLEEEVRELFAQNRHYIGEIDALRAENKVLQSQNEELLVAAKRNADHLELLQKTVEHLVAIATKGLRDADSTPDTAETDGRRG